ncbi:hypothetical protein Scep_004655 [Stephania cephalantha]|uniref:Uncharacterized protein n=1 Tax=Stephania cephalantha TaxID=152367 RepID=A0AAP0PZB4_9MAGN
MCLEIRKLRDSRQFWSSIEAVDKEVKLLSLPRDSCCTNLEDTFDLKSKRKCIYIYIRKEKREEKKK